jgi:truncated hemoglobin YjbI
LAIDDGNYSEAREAALFCMSRALAYLDSDAKIPPIIGAHLQLAIDTLRMMIDGHQGLPDI